MTSLTTSRTSRLPNSAADEAIADEIAELEIDEAAADEALAEEVESVESGEGTRG